MVQMHALLFNLFANRFLFEYFIDACSVKNNVKKVKSVHY